MNEQRGGVAAPSRSVSDIIWIGITFAFVAVFLIGFVALVLGMFVVGPGFVDAGRVEQTAVLAATFLAGLLAGAKAPSVRR